MGKATIISDVGSGQYTASLVYAGRARVNAWVADLTAKIAALEAAIAGMDPGMEKTIAELRVQSFVKKKQYYEAKMPADRTVTIWCADKTEALTGSVGTIEVPGERHDGVNIQPGYEANAVYAAARDGQLLPAVATSAEAAYFNRAIMPGWQKHKPTYRYATIVADSIDFDADTCDVCLDPAYSSQQNLDINQDQGFSECESSPLAGFGQFCTDNPAHPTCTNTDAPAGLNISDAQYETIKSINAAVNAAHNYETDKSGYGVGDQWRIMGPGDKGDCEDFALTKMQALIDAGFDVKNLQLGWGQTEIGQNHAFLIIQTNNRGTLILDNRYPGLMKIENVPYRFQGYQRAGQTWADYTTRLEAVPIEYMSCNAAAFADGDEVLVEFTGQDFSTPKVIGFKNNPSGCGVVLLDEWQEHRWLGLGETVHEQVHIPSDGINRLFVVGIGFETGGGYPGICTVKYGGIELTTIEQEYVAGPSFGGSTPYISNRAWIGYLKDSDIELRADDTIIVTYSGSSGDYDIYGLPEEGSIINWAIFENVNQDNPIESYNHRYHSYYNDSEGNSGNPLPRIWNLSTGLFNSGAGSQSLYFCLANLAGANPPPPSNFTTAPDGYTKITEWGRTCTITTGHRDLQTYSVAGENPDVEFVADIYRAINIGLSIKSG